MARVRWTAPKVLAGAVSLALAGLFPSLAAEPAPRPAPPIFGTQQYALVADIPPGLTYCPLPANWNGSDHGTQVYLVPPDQCGEPRGYSSSMRTPASFVPSIEIFYNRNIAVIHRDDRQDSPPETNAELADQMCGDVYAPLPPGIVLLGTPAAGCRADQDGIATFQAMVLYANADSPANKPDRVLIVSLETTPDRLRSDLAIFTWIAARIRVCIPGSAKTTASPERCPEGANWW